MQLEYEAERQCSAKAGVELTVMEDGKDGEQQGGETEECGNPQHGS